MSVQYREGTKPIPTKYKEMCDVDVQHCPGQCSCDLGTRSTYDQKQFAHYVQGKAENIPVVAKVSGWKL
jgi:hypothetical protein